MNKEYLGDGLYGSFDGWHIILSAEREGVTHWVALEPDVYERLQRYVERLKQGVSIEETEND